MCSKYSQTCIKRSPLRARTNNYFLESNVKKKKISVKHLFLVITLEGRVNPAHFELKGHLFLVLSKTSGSSTRFQQKYYSSSLHQVRFSWMGYIFKHYYKSFCLSLQQNPYSTEPIIDNCTNTIILFINQICSEAIMQVTMWPHLTIMILEVQKDDVI
jgi:hypothetical protein